MGQNWWVSEGITAHLVKERFENGGIRWIQSQDKVKNIKVKFCQEYDHKLYRPPFNTLNSTSDCADCKHTLRIVRGGNCC